MSDGAGERVSEQGSAQAEQDDLAEDAAIAAAAAAVRSDGTAALVLDDLSVDYLPQLGSPRLTALVGLSLRLEAGEVLGIVGPTGSGKTTLTKVIGGLGGAEHDQELRLTGGTMTLLGTTVRGASRRKLERLRLHIGYLPQEAGNQLLPNLTVAENIGEPILSRDRRWDRKDLGIRVSTLMDRLHLPLGLLDRLPHELSSGQRQRVAIARSLILEPTIWVADEPTRGIDVTAWQVVPQMLREEQAARPEFTAVVTGHQLLLESDILDRVLQLERGAQVALASREDYLASGTPYASVLQSFARH